MSNTHVWRAALNRLRSISSVSSAEVDNWLQGAQLVAVSNGVAQIQVGSTYEGDMIEKRYHDVIVRALSDVIGSPMRLEVLVSAQSAQNRFGVRARRPAPPAQAVYARSLFSGDEAVNRNGAEPRDDEPPTEEPAPLRRSSREPVDTAVPSRASLSSVPSHGRRPGAAESAGERYTSAEPAAPAAPSSWTRERETTGGGVIAPQHGRGELRGGGESDDRLAASGVNSMRDDDTGDLRGSAQRRDDGGGYGAPPASYQRRPYELGATPGITPIAPPRLNERYTFSTFIVGSGNQLAHAASQAVADAPGREYNPLFLYGGVGLGKTHLLHAIGHTAVDRGLTVLYVSSETFTNEIVNAILYRQTQEFRAKYRSVDLLLVDDIQFIAGKDSTEEEFFHTFNSLFEMNRQIVICSDRPPKAIISLEERLRSRFEWGLIADIQPPDLETRIAILRAKADLSGKRIADEVILYLAHRVQSNIRELEGSLNRVVAFAELQGLPMTIETAKSAMASLASDTRQRRVSVDDVAQAVAEYYHISLADLQGKHRDKHIVAPRQVAMYLMRQETDASLLEIGQALGGRDHSTVLHGCEKIARVVNENTALRKEVLAIRQQLVG